MKRNWLRILLLLFGVLYLTAAVAAQEVTFNHPELDWFTIKTEHFEVHYHVGAERTAQEIARIAEQIYQPITALYQYKENKIFHFIVRDHDDYSNGITYFYDDKIEIWATPMDFDLRGTHPWLLNVVSHEFTHIISMDKAKKFGDRIQAFYLQYWGYENESRPDVLRGFPNRIVSFPISGVVIPPWFAEGMAQYQTPTTAYDFWDSHRDMILRSAVLADKMLDYNQMGSFGRTGLGNEMVYNSGFSLVNYIAHNYGDATLEQLAAATRRPWRLSFDGAVKAILHKSENELYQEWRESLRTIYRQGISEIKKNLIQGEILPSEGFGNFYPVWSPTKKQVAYVSNNGADYLGLSGIVLYDFETQKAKILKDGVASSISFSPDGSKLTYAKKNRTNKYGSRYFDLFTIDLKTKKERQLTHGARVRNPAWSHDGSKIVLVTGHDGTDNLAIYDFTDGKLTTITQFGDGQQVYHPAWHPDGKLIVFDISTQHGRDLATIDPQGNHLTYLIQKDHDARTPVFHPDGKSIFFAWDKTGIFNIYQYDLKTGKTVAVTNVIGGAFMPAFHLEHGLVYSLYTADGYKIATIGKPEAVEQQPYLAYNNLIRHQPVTALSSIQSIPIVKGANDSAEPENRVKPYRNTYGAMNLLPRLTIDYGTVKLGTYLYSGDVLDKYRVFGGAAVNRDWDMDIFGIFEYRNFYPTIFLEVFNQVQHTSENKDKYKYNLIEADFGLEMPLLNQENSLRAMFVYSRYHGLIETMISGQEIKFGYTYMRGQSYSLLWRHNHTRISRHMEINPDGGRKFELRYDRQHNKFIDGFELNSKYGTFGEKYKPYHYNQFSLKWEEYFALPWHHAVTLKLDGGYIDRSIDSFFNYFAGGILGLKGYPYYSLEGRKLLSSSLIYRFKLSNDLNFHFTPLLFNKLYTAFFFDYGNAWDTGKPQWRQFKKDVGMQLRLDTFSFYNFPMRFFFDVAYGLDEIKRYDSINRHWLQYGKEWRFYFGVVFDYID